MSKVFNIYRRVHACSGDQVGKVLEVEGVFESFASAINFGTRLLGRDFYSVEEA